MTESNALCVCTTCNHIGEPKIAGSDFIELILWLTFIVPGAIYSAWRRDRRRNICPVCGATAMIPTASPKGVEIAQSSEKQFAVLQEKSAAIEKRNEVRKKEKRFFNRFVAIGVLLLIIMMMVLQGMAQQ